MAIEDYLTADEEVQLQWAGQVKSGLQNVAGGAVDFAATNTRILVVSSSGSSKDIDYSHVSSVEVKSSPEYSFAGTQWYLILGFFFLPTGLIMLLVGSPDQTNLAGVNIILGLGLLVYYWDDFDGFGNLIKSDETTVYKITLITGDEDAQQISFKTTDDIGATLSRIVREAD